MPTLVRVESNMHTADERLPIPRHKGHGAPKIYPEDMDPAPVQAWIDGGMKGDPPKGGTFYTRTTTFIDNLDDKSLLVNWKERKTIEAFHAYPEFHEKYAAIHEPDGAGKKEVERLCKQAREAVHTDLRALQGDVLHKLTETYDETGKIPPAPAEYLEDLNTYILATQDLGMLGVEVFVVHDEYKYAGTADRFIRVTGDMAKALGVADGDIITGDLKTGSSVGFSKGKYPMQFAGYANAKLYDPYTFKRSPIAFDGQEINKDVGLMIHLPVGEKICTLYKCDLIRGYEDIKLAKAVQEYRRYWNRKANGFDVVREVIN